MSNLLNGMGNLNRKPSLIQKRSYSGGERLSGGEGNRSEGRGLRQRVINFVILEAAASVLNFQETSFHQSWKIHSNQETSICLSLLYFSSTLLPDNGINSLLSHQ